MTKVINGRDFDEDVSRAKRLADAGPLVITDHGEPACVLLTHELYARLIGTTPSILDLLADPSGDDIPFEAKRLKGGRIRPADLGRYAKDREAPPRATSPLAYLIAFRRFSSTRSRNPVVESHPCSAPTSRAMSFVMSPASTVSTHTRSKVAAKRSSAAF